MPRYANWQLRRDLKSRGSRFESEVGYQKIQWTVDNHCGDIHIELNPSTYSMPAYANWQLRLHLECSGSRFESGGGYQIYTLWNQKVNHNEH